MKEHMMAIAFGLIALAGLVFAVADLRAAYKDLIRAETWANNKPEHEMMRHAFRAQGALSLALAILALIAVLALTPVLPFVFAPLMFGVVVILTIDAVLSRLSRLRILKMIRERPDKE